MTRYSGGVLQVFGNGSWVSLDQGSTGATCSTAGQLRYNASATRAEFCNGVTWRSLNSGGTSTGSGSAGMTRYAANQFQYHNGTTWIVAGSTPLHRWKLDETTGTTLADSAPASPLHGTLSGAANVTSESSAVVNTGLAFDGSDDRVSVPNTGGIFLTAPFTWSMWVKFDDVTTHRYLLRMAHSASPWYAYILRVQSGGITVTANNSAGTGFSTLSNDSVTTGTWYHIAFTMSSAYQMRLYINGVLQTDTDTPGSLYAANSNLIVGGNNGVSEQIDGSMDDVRFYSTALSDTEIASIFSESALGPTYIAHSTSQVPSGTTMTLTKPTGLKVGDLMHAWISKNNNSVTAPPSAAGWTALASYWDASIGYLGSRFYKIADSADVAAANFAFTFGSSVGDSFGILSAYRSVSPYTPIAFSTDNDGNGTTATYLGGTTTFNNSVVVAIAAGTSTSPSLPTGFTSRQTGLWQSVMSDRLYGTAGSVSNFTSTTSAGDWTTAVTALNPENGPPVAPIRVVQTTPKAAQANVQTLNTSFSNLPSAGNTIIVTASNWRNGGLSRIVAVTDNQGNTYQQAAQTQGSNGQGNSASIWYAKNIGTPSGTFTITVDPDNTDSTNYLVFNAIEVTGLNATAPLDVSVTGSGGVTGDATVGPSSATTQSDEIVVAVASVSNADANINVNVPVGFTMIGAQQDSNAIVGYSGIYKTTTATGTQSASWIHDNTGQGEWAAVLATFK